MPTRLDPLKIALEGLGLLLRGGFAVDPLDNLGATKTVLMIGNAGPAMWLRFREAHREEPDPLDRWVRRQLTPIAEAMGADLAMPNDGPPYLPFQRWAMRAEPIHPSPLGLLIHQTYGLWHAYRAALLLPETVSLPARAHVPSPCETCADQPCLSTCPVGAFTADGYDAEACIDHLGTDEGADCLSDGCRARRACPVGTHWRTEPEQAAFHMRAFIS
jgi:hypothetical protein